MILVLILVAGLGLVNSAVVNVNRTETAVPQLRVTVSGTFQQGFDTCRSWGMWPLSIHNEATQIAAMNACNTAHRYDIFGFVCYIGLRRSTTANGPTWYYVDGSVFDYQAWDSSLGQPGTSETCVAIARSGSVSVNWRDYGWGTHMLPMICGVGAASESPMPSNSPSVTPTRSQTPSASMTTTSTSSASMSASNTPGVCRPYCVGEFGLCQNPVWEDFTCYEHDSAGNCPVNTVSCPDVVEADTVVPCQSCAMGTSGSCQHPVDGVCAEHLDSGVCPPSLIFCGSTF